MSTKLELNDVNIYYGDFHAVQNVNMQIPAKSVTAFIGPSGCGKSTVLRTLNRMHEVIPNASVKGEILLDGHDIYGKDVDPVAVRNTIGMVFQKANPFPTMSIEDNVVAGLKLSGEKNKKKLKEVAERSLRGANLWDEVKDRLDKPGGGLSGGQQQRLCIARAIAVRPEVLLMDEPCSALDPISTLAVEDLIHELKNDFTIVIVTQHAAGSPCVRQDRVLLPRGHRQAGPPGGVQRHHHHLRKPGAERDRRLHLRPLRLEHPASRRPFGAPVPQGRQPRVRNFRSMVANFCSGS